VSAEVVEEVTAAVREGIRITSEGAEAGDGHHDSEYLRGGVAEDRWGSGVSENGM